jgi:hypothetical protein
MLQCKSYWNRSVDATFSKFIHPIRIGPVGKDDLSFVFQRCGLLLIPSHGNTLKSLNGQAMQPLSVLPALKGEGYAGLFMAGKKCKGR